MSLVRKQERGVWVAWLVLLFAGLFTLFWLFPLVGDDWYREALGMTLHSPLDLLESLRNAGTSARVLGNVLAYTAGSRPMVRELMRTLFTLVLIVLLAKVSGLWSWRGMLLCAAVSIALPREMFCQIYPWAAGFFNYLPPVVMLLGSLVLVRPVLTGEALEESTPRGIALFLLGLGQQMFIENHTLYALCASFVLLVWYWRERKKISACLGVFFLGSLLGAALMFGSPSYGLIGQEGGAYQLGAGGTLAGLLSTASVNVREVARYYILDCPVLYWSLTVLALLHWGREKRGTADRVLAALVTLGSLGLAWGGFKPMAVAAVWGIALTAGLCRWTKERAVRAGSLFLWLSALVAAAPLLVVNPIGPRCLFLSYILLLGTAGVLLSALDLDALSLGVRSVIPAVAAAGVLCYYLAVYWPFHQLELLRTQILEEAIAHEASEVVLPAYEHRGYLWDADSGYKMEQVYYLERPGDLTITFALRSELEAEGRMTDFSDLYTVAAAEAGQEG